jgi:glycosyltransferase involved in cell wall biosynthesis
MQATHPIADVKAEAAPSGEPDLHIVVPVYNEAENFPSFYESLSRHVRTPFRLLVVYDHEEDTTLPVARRFAERDARVVLLKNTGRGVLGALKTGLAQPRSGAVLVTMADGSDDHRCVDTMYALYGQGHHLVSASRYSRGGEQRGGPLVKGLLSRAAGTSLHLLAGVETWDATNNFKLYSVELLRQVEIESQGGFELALELTVKAHRLGLRMAEVPTVWTDRVAGKSNFKLVKWLPRYLKWYVEALRFAVLPGTGANS